MEWVSGGLIYYLGSSFALVPYLLDVIFGLGD